MTEERVDNQTLRHLRELARRASPGPWRSMVEGRDHLAGDTFIMVGVDKGRSDDLYLYRENRPASVADHDFIAAARNYIEPLVDEIERLRHQLDNRSANE